VCATAIKKPRAGWIWGRITVVAVAARYYIYTDRVIDIMGVSYWFTTTDRMEGSPPEASAFLPSLPLARHKESEWRDEAESTV
jgi:hypothetical protein